MTRKRLYIFVAALLLLGLPLMSAAQIDVTLPESVDGSAEDTVMVPVTTTDLTGEGVESYEFTLSFDSAVMEVVDYEAGPVSEGMTIVTNAETDGEFSVAASSTADLSGSGVLGELKVAMKAQGATHLTWSTFLFNAGTPAATTTDCQVVVDAVRVGLKDIKGQVPDSAVVPIHVSDMTGLDIESFEFTLNYNESIMNVYGVDKSGTLSKDMTVTSNDGDGELNVAASYTTGDVLSGSGTLLNLHVEFTGAGTDDVRFGDFLFNDGTPPVITADTAKVTVSPQFSILLNDLQFGEIGDTVDLTLAVDGKLTGSEIESYEFELDYPGTLLDFLEVDKSGTASENMTVTPNSTNGTLNVAAASTENLTGEDIDLLHLKFEVVDGGEGQAYLNSFQFNDGTPVANTEDTSKIEIGLVDITLPDASGLVGDTVMYPINVEDLTDLGIEAYEFTLNYDNSIAEVIDYDKAGTLSESFSVQMDKSTPGEVTVAAAMGTEALSGEGVLLNLEVVLNSEGTADFTWTDFMFNDGTPTEATHDGTLEAIIEPIMSIYPMEIDMATPMTGETVKDTIEISNTGNGDLVVSGLTATGDLTASFSGTIAAGADTSVEVSWTPAIVGVMHETVTVSSNDPDAHNEVAVKGAAKDDTYDNMNFEGEHPGWTELSGTWGYSGYKGHEGQAIFTYDEDAELMSPKLDLSGENNFVSYYINGPNLNDTGTVVLELSTDGGDTWTMLDSTGWDQTTWYWMHIIVELPTTDGESYLKFRMNQDSYEWHVNKIDDITYPGPPPYEEMSIAEARVDANRDFVPDLIGETVKITGIINSPNYSTENTEMYMQDTEAGIGIFKNDEILDLTKGDEVSIIGEISQYNGLTQIEPDTFEVLSTGNDLPEPVTMADIASLEEAEGMLFKMEEARLIEDAWPSEGQSDGIDIYEIVGEESDTLTMFIDQETDLDGWSGRPGIDKKFDVVGVMNQYDYSEPYDSYYELLPRSQDDITNIVSEIETEDGLIPDEFALRDNYPNPFNPTTTIAFDVPKTSDISLKIYSINGRLVKEVTYENMKPGYHKYRFNAASLSSGVYLYRLQADGFTKVRKMTLIK
jgi:hypothetical protein